jgi:hypothetical protein
VALEISAFRCDPVGDGRGEMLGGAYVFVAGGCWGMDWAEMICRAMQRVRSFTPCFNERYSMLTEIQIDG